MESLVNKADMGFLGFLILFLILGAILLIFKKKKVNKIDNTLQIKPSTKTTFKNDIVNNDIELAGNNILKTEKDKNNQLLSEIKLQESELLELKLQNLLTDEEYSIKKNIVLKRKEEITKVLDKIKLDQEYEKVRTFINDLIKPQILLLENILKSGLLIQEEFENKKNQLFNEKYNMLPYLNPDIQLNFEVINENALRGLYKSDIDASLPKFKIGDVILFNKKKKKLHKFSLDKFIELNKSENVSEYSFIKVQNFLSRIGYPQLQKELNNKILSNE